MTPAPAPGLLARYERPRGAYDELLGPSSGAATPTRLATLLDARSASDLSRAQALAEHALLQQGVTFSVYADQRGTEKILPFCVVPRVITASDFQKLERGLEQRVRALQLFLDDMYGPQRILESGTLPRDLILGAKGFRPKLLGVRPPGGVRVHVAGIDLIRDPEGIFRVLEDNLRTPSGVSYVISNRAISKRVLPDLFDRTRVHRVDHYPTRLADTLRAVSPVSPEETEAVVLTPGPFNSAYFEHSFLALRAGLELVEPSDLFVDAERVFVRTTRGPKRVHVIYRRIDDDYLDPEVFKPDSLLGVRGLVGAWAAGNVALANAPGNGVADDKAVYPFVPDMIKYYLGEEPLLAQVPTYVCLRDADRKRVLEELDRLVVKAVDEAGGYGMLMGPQASLKERSAFRERILAEPRRYIAQPLVELSTCPTWSKDTEGLVARRVDMRPYVLTSPEGPWVLPGGLTRVALVEGSYVVNSSQGGGSKDTWVERP